MLQDLRFAVRTLRRQAGFTVIATLTLALGVGATTAIFTAVNAVLLSQLPFRDADRLYAFETVMTDGRPTGGGVSAVEIDRIAALADLVEQVGGTYRYEGALIDSAGNPLKVTMQGVVAGFFDVFGLPLVQGRTFLAEDASDSGPTSVILSHRAWTNWFAADPGLVGRSVVAEGQSLQVVGIAEEGFSFPAGTDVWLYLGVPPTDTGHTWAGILRTRPGVSIERLRSALDALSGTLQQDFPAANAGRVLATNPLRDDVVGSLGTTLLVILAAAGLLLLVACVNVTSLLLSRGVVRAREVALRVALGASRWRIFRQLLTESIVLAGVGALAGMGLAALFLAILLAAGAADLPRLDEVRLNAGVLAFALGATAVTGLVVGFAPALRLVSTDVKSLVNESGRSGSGGPATHRLLGAMVVAEIALAVLLTIGAALLLRSFQNLQNVDPGFEADGRIVFEVTLPVFSYQDYDRIADWMGLLLDRIAALPGVTRVGAVTSAPFAPELDGVVTFWPTRGGVPPVEQRPRARRRAVSPDFFSAAGIRMVAGRGFLATDRRDTPGVVIVDELFARQFFPDGDAIGQRITTRTTPEPTQGPLLSHRPAEAEIVGIVSSVRYASPGLPPEPTYYYALEQLTDRQQIVVVETGLSDPAGLIAGVRGAVREADPTLPVEYYDMGQLLHRALARERLSMTLLTLFGAGALLLAAIGIYGIMSYAVAQRRAEFAVRAALGAQPASILRLVLAQGRTMALAGVGLGLGAAILAGRYLESQVFGLSTTDPIVLAGVGVLMLLVVGISTLVPAWRASRVPAASVLRG